MYINTELDFKSSLKEAKDVRLGKDGHSLHINLLNERGIVPVPKDIMPDSPQKGDIWFLERKNKQFNPPMVLLGEGDGDRFRVYQIHIDPSLSRRNKDLIVPALFNAFGEIMIEVWNSYDVNKDELSSYCGRVDDMVLDAVTEMSMNMEAQPPLWSPLPPRHVTNEAVAFAELETEVAMAYAYIPEVEAAKEPVFFKKAFKALRKKFSNVSLPFSLDALHMLPMGPEPVAAASDMKDIPVGFIHYQNEDTFQIATLSARIKNQIIEETKDKSGVTINLGGTLDLGEKAKLFEAKDVSWTFSVAWVVARDQITGKRYYAAKMMDFDPEQQIFQATIMVPSWTEANRGRLSFKVLASSWS